MRKIVLPYRETKKGMAFTKAEERKLVDFCIQKQDNAVKKGLFAHEIRAEWHEKSTIIV